MKLRFPPLDSPSLWVNCPRAMIDLKLLREKPQDVIATYRDRLYDHDAAKLAEELIALDG